MRFTVPTILALASVAVAGTDCVTQYRDCLSDSSNTPGYCANIIAVCKNECAEDVYGACLRNGTAGTTCMGLYNNCLDPVTSIAATFYTTDCVTKYTTCRSTGNNTEGFCSDENAKCKNECNVVYGTCLSSGSADDPACLWQYNACLDSFTASGTPSSNTTSTTDCVSALSSCDSAGVLTGPECSAQDTVCKNACAVIQDTCLTSGDASLKPACLSQYDLCLDSSSADTALDCVSRASACAAAGTSASDCAAQNTVCKNSCAVIQDTCRSSGDDSMTPLCTSQFDACLGSYANGTALATSASSSVVPTGTGAVILTTAPASGAAGNVTTGRNASASATPLAYSTGAAGRTDVAGLVGLLGLVAAFAL